jgi:hypothetical protein
MENGDIFRSDTDLFAAWQLNRKLLLVQTANDARLTPVQYEAVYTRSQAIVAHVVGVIRRAL